MNSFPTRVSAGPAFPANEDPGFSDLIVFSHLRWDFVFQRPQHLLTRFAKNARVFYVEEPVLDAQTPHLIIHQREKGVQVVVPHLPSGLEESHSDRIQRKLLDRLLEDYQIKSFALWFYSAMALPFARHLKAKAVVYDCMDELSSFKGAHPKLLSYESELFKKADLVFTGGHHLYEFKKHRHRNIHPFPSSIDFDHFAKARTTSLIEPPDQKALGGPRIGFFGVIDERMNLELLDGLATSHPEWQIVILGPVVKINPDTLPCRPNLHFLGQKSYAQLPSYIAGWDVAILPFALNESTRFISPTKTPEYLAAGKPVVSTSIRDVIFPYGENGMVFIADTVKEFGQCIESAIDLPRKNPYWLKKVDQFLAQTSWDRTWAKMQKLVAGTLQLQRERALQAS